MEDRGPPAGHVTGVIPPEGRGSAWPDCDGGSEPGQGGPGAWTRWVLEDPEPLTQPEPGSHAGPCPVKVPQGTLPALLELPWLTAACRGPWSPCSLASFLPLWACPHLASACLLSVCRPHLPPPLHAQTGRRGLTGPRDEPSAL